MDTTKLERLCKAGIAISLATCSVTTGCYSVLSGGELRWWLGAAGVCSGTLSLVLGVAHAALRWSNRPEVAVHTRYARRSELAAVRKLAVEFFGDAVSSLERLNAWYRHDSRIVSVIYTVGGGVGRRIRQLAGYFVTLRLRESGLRQLLDGTAKVGDLAPVDLCSSSREQPAAIYIGALAANGHRAKGAALQAMMSQVSTAARGKRDTRIIARPITDHGMRLVKAYGFQPIRGEGEGQLGQLHEATLQTIDEAINGPVMA